MQDVCFTVQATVQILGTGETSEYGWNIFTILFDRFMICMKIFTSLNAHSFQKRSEVAPSWKYLARYLLGNMTLKEPVNYIEIM